jgi:hypothetical protein
MGSSGDYYLQGEISLDREESSWTTIHISLHAHRKRYFICRIYISLCWHSESKWEVASYKKRTEELEKISFDAYSVLTNVQNELA